MHGLPIDTFRSLEWQLKETKAENKRRQKQKANARKVIQKFGVITVAEGRSLAKKRKVADEKKLANKRKKRAKTPTPEDRKSTRLNSSHCVTSRMPSSA